MNDALRHFGRTGLLDKWQLACAYKILTGERGKIE